MYLFLRQQTTELFYFREKGECDFVVMEKGVCKKVIQVCEQLHSENKLREITGLKEAMNFFALEEGFIYTLDQEDEFIVEGKKIIVKKVRDSLM